MNYLFYWKIYFEKLVMMCNLRKLFIEYINEGLDIMKRK